MFNKKFLEMFRHEVKTLLAPLEEKYNLSINPKKIKYSDSEFTLQIKVNKSLVNGKSYEQSEFEKYCGLYNLAPSDYHRKFARQGDDYVITGFSLKSPKYPILVKRERDGKIYKFSIEAINESLEKNNG